MANHEQGIWGPHNLGYTAHTMALRQGGGSSIQLACGSFINFVEVLASDLESPQAVRSAARLPHYFPPTRVRWLSPGPGGPELLVTSGDYLRIWSAGGELRGIMQHEANPQERCTPITSVDVSIEAGVSGGVHLASCDIYGICSLWDTERGVMQQAVDLGQPLCDVAFGPAGLVAVAGDRGDCFLVDARQPGNVEVMTPERQVHGPARVAWGSRRPGLFAVTWQDEKDGGIALYSSAQSSGKGTPRLLQRSPGAAAVADLQWSPAFPELLCCASEDGGVEVWHFPEDSLTDAAAATGPCFTWSPGGRVETCTALALTTEVRPGQHAIALATAPVERRTPQGQNATSHGGSLRIAALPQPSSGRGGGFRRAQPITGEGSTAEAAARALPAPGPCAGGVDGAGLGMGASPLVAAAH
eukprot:CAMPEP_0179023994 /NCGR_PEP_ID=MMETSP0796-20121207/7224_1 /TAXON_ID=73915 /ORGANISM="Pyrodinium bahamense, Strain pbaha01" /LENGTH=413 /DNA_ID=CAMNT_0020719937 /DNA_START=37 /DNA_END=1278 /DNA_ORIENTATION=+